MKDPCANGEALYFDDSMSFSWHWVHRVPDVSVLFCRETLQLSPSKNAFLKRNGEDCKNL